MRIPVSASMLMECGRQSGAVPLWDGAERRGIGLRPGRSRGQSGVAAALSGRTPKHRQSGFTMIEIAICLAIIGFALVAIIGVLPSGLDVQKNNREETIIDQDAQIWMDAIRNGAQGYDYLTNYVTNITVTVYNYQISRNSTNFLNKKVFVYTPTSSNPSGFPLTTGARIVGLLSTPQITDISGRGFASNSIVAQVRAISGSAAEKFPQDNQTVLDESFGYRLIAENASTPMNWSTNTVDQRMAAAFQANLRQVRLLFRWPLLPNGNAGTGRQTFRADVGGTVQAVSSAPPKPTLYFFQPSSYVQQ